MDNKRIWLGTAPIRDDSVFARAIASYYAPGMAEERKLFAGEQIRAACIGSLGNRMDIKKVIFNEPATIVFWGDGSKTVVKAQNGEQFDPEKGIAMAFMKKYYGNKGKYFNRVKKWTKEYVEPATQHTLCDRCKFRNVFTYQEPCKSCRFISATTATKFMPKKEN